MSSIITQYAKNVASKDKKAVHIHTCI